MTMTEEKNELATKDTGAELALAQGVGRAAELTRSEMDAQLDLAARRPRSLQAFDRAAKSMATMTPEVAASCKYKLPFKGGIEGPSIRLAEICASAYGNLKFGSRMIAEEQTYVIAQGYAIDLQTNNAATREVKVSIVQKDGRRMSPDMVATLSNAAAAKALRNAIFSIIPRALIDGVMEAAMDCARGDLKTLPERRAAALKKLNGKGVTDKMILEKLGRKGIEDIDLADLEELFSLFTAINEGHGTVAEIFSDSAKTINVPKQTAAEKLKAGKRAGAVDPDRAAADEEARQRMAAEQREPGDDDK